MRVGRATRVWAAVAAMVTAFGWVAVSPQPAQGAEPTSATELILDLTNEFRAQYSHEPLAWNAGASDVAQAWSVHMLQSDKLYHNPDYPEQMPIGWTEVSENVGYACGYGGAENAARRIVEGWKNSAGHRANMVRGTHTDLGVGLAYDPITDCAYATQNLGTYPSDSSLGSIEGSVLLPTGVDADWHRGVVVEFLGPTRTQALLSSDGSFASPALEVGDYVVRFSVVSYREDGVDVVPALQAEYFDNAATASTATPVTVTSGGTTRIEAALDRSVPEAQGGIRGTVELVPAADLPVIVTLYSLDHAGDRTHVASRVTMDGSYAFSDVDQGTYVVLFEVESTWDPSLDMFVPPYATEYFGDAASLSGAERIEVSSGVVAGVDAYLETSRVIGGTVVMPDGVSADALGAITVTATVVGGADHGDEVASVLPDQESRFTMPALKPGRYRVLIAAEGEQGTTVGAGLADLDLGIVDVTEQSQRNLVAALSLLPVPVPTLVDIATNPFREEIEWLAATGVTTGWSVGAGVAEFRPLQNVKRDQMAAFLYRLAGRPEYTPPTTPTFRDVPAGHVFFTEIEWLADLGITQGWTVRGVKEFRPTASVNRDIMAAFLYRFAGAPDFEATGRTFIDVSTAHVFYDEIEWLAQSGITNGWSTGRGQEFRPSAAVKRDVMAAFLSRFDHLVGLESAR